MTDQEIMKDRGGYFLNPEGNLMQAVNGMILDLMARFHKTHPTIQDIATIFAKSGDAHYKRWTIPEDRSLFPNSDIQVSGRVLFENIETAKIQLQKADAISTLPFPASIILASNDKRQSISLSRAVTLVEPFIMVLDIVYLNGTRPQEHISAKEVEGDSVFIKLAQSILRELTSTSPTS